MKSANLTISILLIVFGSAYAYLITQLPDRNLPNTLGGAFMPWLLVICLFVLSALLSFNTIFNQSRETFDPRISLKEGTGILFLTFFIFIYVKAMSLFGFILITPVFLAILMLMTGSRKWKEIVITSVVAPVCIYFFFQKIFRVILPGGIFF